MALRACWLWHSWHSSHSRKIPIARATGVEIARSVPVSGNHGASGRAEIERPAPASGEAEIEMPVPVNGKAEIGRGDRGSVMVLGADRKGVVRAVPAGDLAPRAR